MTDKPNTQELTSITNDLAKVVSEVCLQIELLKEERTEATGEVKDAYNLVIQNKVWILQQLIGGYWRKTLNLELDKPEITADVINIPTATHFIDVSASEEEAISNAGRQ